MNMTIAGYQVHEKIYESGNSLVYRATRKAGGRGVILKTLKNPYPPPERIAWFHREYEMTRSLNLPGVIDVYELATDQHRPVMILEDFGGESLERILKARQRPFAVTEFLPLAIQTTDILANLHRQNVMHKNINPSNIVWNPKTDQVKFIDFGLSTTLSRENPALRDLVIGEGMLTHISPEQTGRMNRALDYRTDFYSLGATFYELLSGQPPFPFADAMTLVHAHLAQQPTPLSDQQSAIPQALSAIVMKLLEKNAEDRYQSAPGLKKDLEECWRQWQKSEDIVPFLLGQQDVPDRFYIPQKLYGRELEIAALLATFKRVRHGTGEVLFVTGYSGVGKSSLVHEIYKPITQQHGYFGVGKCDQLQRNIPYGPFAQALRDLLRRILTESASQVSSWRERLLAALGANGQVIVDIIPEVELIIGPQPSLPLLPPAEARNRFNLVFQDFLGVLARPEHPLVLFLDDLQWADGASLQLLQQTTSTLFTQYILIIGAYRENEVSEAHPLMLIFNEIQKSGNTINKIRLNPLNVSDVNQLISDTFHCEGKQSRPLAELVMTKTGGNPFFVNEFLESLHAEKHLTFNFQSNRWEWNVARIRSLDTTDNVVELLIRRVQNLKEETQRVLQAAACIGNQFDTDVLSIALGKSQKEISIEIRDALESGLIIPLSTIDALTDDIQGSAEEVRIAYRFTHDRVQDAAYSLIPEKDKQAFHYQLGQRLLHSIDLEKRKQNLFEIVDQLNLGLDYVKSDKEQDELVELNLMASKRAKAEAAYEPAFEYILTGIELLREDIWQRQYELARDLYTGATEAAYLNGDYTQMEIMSNEVLQNATNLLDKIQVYECLIEAGYADQHRIEEGVQIGLHALELLGMELPKNPSQEDVLQSIDETRKAIAGIKIEALLDLPEMTDPHLLAAVRILMRMFTTAYVGNPELFSLIVLHMVRLSIKNGNTSLSARAYAAYGFMLSTVVGDIEGGYAFGQLALNLVERFHARDIQASVLYLVNGFVRFWKDPLRETLDDSLEAYRVGLETGAVEYAAVSAFSYNFKAYWSGKNLTILEHDMDQYGEAIKKLKQEMIADLNALQHQVVLNLMGYSKNPFQLVGTSYDEEKMFPLLLEVNNINALSIICLNKMILCYLFRDYTQSVTYANMTEKYLRGMQGTSAIPVFYYYDSLSKLAIYPDAASPEQSHLLEKIEQNQERMKKWSHHAPMNFLHKFYLVEAERARVQNDENKARECYDNAIDLAREHAYLNEEALASELAARFYLARGHDRIAYHYLQDAHYAYLKWEAFAKVKDLEGQYPQFLAGTSPDFPQVHTFTPPVRPGDVVSRAFDLASVLRASQAISGEIVLSKLLDKLMRTIIENAGAQRSFLLLENEGRLLVEAEQTVDQDGVVVLQSVPIEMCPELPSSLIRFVERTRENVVLNDVTQEGLFTTDPYIVQKRPKSILCAPLLHQGKLSGIIYLENNVTIGAFTSGHLEVVNLLASQAAISIASAKLYQSLAEANKKIGGLQ